MPDRIRLVLDDHGSYYTNLSTISGRVILNVQKEMNVEAIVVKVEGHSQSVVLHAGQMAPIPGSHAQVPSEDHVVTRPPSERHDLLYLSQEIFPPQNQRKAGKQKATTLKAGEHVYPFKFTLPFNNSCKDPEVTEQRSSSRVLSMKRFKTRVEKGLSIAPPPANHVIAKLPPTWTGIPSVASVEYFVKASVERSGFWQEKLRAMCHFDFLPIESSRPPPEDGERIVLRSYTFQPDLSVRDAGNDRGGSNLAGLGPSIELSARLPNPPVLTRKGTVPLRLVVKKQAETGENLFLTGLRINLVGYTEVTAGLNSFKGSEVYTVFEKVNLQIKIGDASDPVGTETEIDNSLWRDAKIPLEAPPSFTTCNIKRFYGVIVKVGIGCGQTPEEAEKRTMFIPLRLAVLFLSGVSPPPALLERMNAAHEREAFASAPADGQDLLPEYSDAPPIYEDFGDGELLAASTENKSGAVRS